MSDTHGDAAAVRRAVHTCGPVDFWLHAGDYSQDAYLVRELTGLNVIAAAGNCDGQTDAKIDEFIDAGNNKIWLTHGHRYQAKTRVDDLAWWATKYEVDVVIYGHTHVPHITKQDGIIIFNPGSAARPRGGSRHSIGLIEIATTGAIECQLVEIPVR